MDVAVDVVREFFRVLIFSAQSYAWPIPDDVWPDRDDVDIETRAAEAMFVVLSTWLQWTLQRRR